MTRRSHTERPTVKLIGKTALALAAAAALLILALIAGIAANGVTIG